MKKVLAYTLANLILLTLTTLFVGSILTVAFCVILGIITFIMWAPPNVWPSIWIWFIIRLSVGMGFVVAIFFALSKEGREVVDDFVKDGFKL
jgi:hypothetical protein